MMKKNKKNISMNGIGGSGTIISEGIISDEYNPALDGLNGMDKYERMRRSDAQCSAVLMVCELPLRSAKWTVDPFVDENGHTSTKDKEIAEFITNALFDRMDTTFDEFLIEVFTMLPFGFSVFEKIYKVEDGRIYIKKLASRKQTTIDSWTENGIKQKALVPFQTGKNKGKNEAIIPWNKVVVFTHKKEGDNHTGVSILRPAYKHWHIKDQLYKFDAVRHERQAVGIPVMYIPSDATEDDKAEAQRIVNNIRASEQTGIVIPGTKEEGWLFEFADMKSGSSNTNILDSIKHHNREITKTVLAQFLELGYTASGSRAVGETMTEMFLMATQSIGNYIANIIKKNNVK